MDITPDVILEQVLDGLAMGDLGQAVGAFGFTRTGSGAVVLDYGPGSRFTLTVAPID